MVCACCGATFRDTGCTVPLYRQAPGRPGTVETAWWPLFRCAGCGSLYAEVDDASFASHLGAASYTDPRHEGAFRGRRQGFFRWIAGLPDAETGDRLPSSPPPGPRPRALDFGCSYGHLLEAFRDRGWDVAGVESTDRAREIARKNLPEAAVEARLEDLGGAPFDAVTMIDVLYCLRRPDEVLAALRDRMAPAGTLVVRTTNRVWLYEALRLLRRDRLPTAVMGSARWAFTRRGLEHLLAKAGFRDVRYEEAEVGKEFGDFRVALYYGVTGRLARWTGGRIALQGGIFLTARKAQAR